MSNRLGFFNDLMVYVELDMHLKCFVVFCSGVKWSEWWWSNAMHSELKAKEAKQPQHISHFVSLCVYVWLYQSEMIDEWKYGNLFHRRCLTTPFVWSPQAKIFVSHLTFAWACVCVRFEIECFCLLTFIETICSFLWSQ